MSLRRRIVTFALLLSLVAVYAAQFVAAYDDARVSGEQDAVAFAFSAAPEQFIEQGAVTRGLIEDGEWWRMLTAIFLHAGVLHLVFNGWGLLQFGALLEALYGSFALLATFLVSGAVASITSSLFLQARYGVGASGAIFGIVGVLLIVIGRHAKRNARVVQLQLALWAAVTLIAGFMAESVDNAAHLGGLATGLAIGVLLRRRATQRAGSSPAPSSSSSARLTGRR